MVLQMFSVFDKKTVVYGRPFFAHNRGHAMRLVGDELVNDDSLLAAHPDDFALYEVGSFDDSLGIVGGLLTKGPTAVCEIKDLVVSAAAAGDALSRSCQRPATVAVRQNGGRAL